MSQDWLHRSPAEAWQPYEPNGQAPWDHSAASHLIRRTGFGGNWSEVDQAFRQGPQAAVSELFAQFEELPAFEAKMSSFAKHVLAGGETRRLSAWWVYRMIHSPCPLQERMNLFWHNHFATSAAKIENPKLIYEQFGLFNQHALGSFKPLVQAISKDPAMLLWLDSDTNRRSHPNENYARELLELFCLGIGNYTETDIQELARCFTGWEVQHGKFSFRKYRHDPGQKTLLGKTGNFSGEEAIDIIMQHPATSMHLARKLSRTFIAEEPELSDEYLQPLADRIQETDYDMQAAVEFLLRSRVFHSPQVRGKIVRSPVDWMIGSIRQWKLPVNTLELAREMGSMGQMLFFPPNVKGWDGGRTWLTTSGIMRRHNGWLKLMRTSEDQHFALNQDKTFPDVPVEDELFASHCFDWWLAKPLPADVRDQLVRFTHQADLRQPETLKKWISAIYMQPEAQLA